MLTKALSAHEEALSRMDSAQTGLETSEFRGNLGIGRIQFWRGYCNEEIEVAMFDPVVESYGRALKVFESNPKTYLVLEAATGYQDLGFVFLLKFLIDPDAYTNLSADGDQNLSDSTDLYRTGFELAMDLGSQDGVEFAVNLSPYYFLDLCMQDMTETVSSALHRFDEVSSPQNNHKIQIQERTLHLAKEFPFLDHTNWEVCVNAK